MKKIFLQVLTIIIAISANAQSKKTIVLKIYIASLFIIFYKYTTLFLFNLNKLYICKKNNPNK